MDSDTDVPVPSEERGGIPDAGMVQAGDISGTIPVPRSAEELLADGPATKVVINLEPLNLEEISHYPALAKCNNQEMQIIALSAIGFSPVTIAKGWGMNPLRVKRVLATYDPQRRFQLSKKAKRAFLTRMLEARAAEAIAYITPEKLEKSNAVALATIAEKLLRTVSSFDQKDNTRVIVGSVTDILNRLKKPIELKQVENGSYEADESGVAGGTQDKE